MYCIIIGIENATLNGMKKIGAYWKDIDIFMGNLVFRADYCTLSPMIGVRYIRPYAYWHSACFYRRKNDGVYAYTYDNIIKRGMPAYICDAQKRFPLDICECRRRWKGNGVFITCSASGLSDSTLFIIYFERKYINWHLEILPRKWTFLRGFSFISQSSLLYPNVHCSYYYGEISWKHTSRHYHHAQIVFNGCTL